MDILQQLIDILGINCSLVNCYYPNPIEGLFYLVFFPSVFAILFIYVLSGSIIRGSESFPKGLRLLIGISVFLFIIFQGWYTALVSISKLWFILIIILGGLWWFIKAHFGEGGKAGGGFPALQRWTGLPKRKVAGIITGEEKSLENAIKNELSLMDTIIGNCRRQIQKGLDVGKLMEEFWRHYENAQSACNALKTYDPLKARKYQQDINKKVEEARKISPKA